MTTELTQAPTESGPVAVSAANSDKSQSHRRRRRRRKNKGAAPAAPQTQPTQAAAPPPAQPAPPPPPKAAHQAKPPRKKKFFQKNAQPGNAQPGNGSTSQLHQSKQRKPKQQRTPRQFVGPMDHSYRIANGNVADGPPSTIQLANGNAQMDHFSGAYAPAAPIREDAAPRIYCFIEDLFFTAKINEASRKLGVKVEFVKGAAKEDLARLTELPEDERPKLLVFDLNNLNAKPMTVIPKFKSKFKRATSIIGFLNHLQGELKAKAIEAGCDTVMPRSAFSQSLPNLLRRYGLDDDEDFGQQPT